MWGQTVANESLFSKLFSKLQSKLPGTQQNQVQAPAPRLEAPYLKLIIFIVDWNRAKVISGVFEEEKVRFHFISKGRGTANSDILDLLGIGASDKAVILCIEQAVMVPVLLKEVRKKLGFHSPGAGIAFTMPVSGINSPILKVFKQSIHKNEKIAAEANSDKLSGEATFQTDLYHKSDGSAGLATQVRDRRDHSSGQIPPWGERRKSEGGGMSGEFSHDLIIAIINQGYSDEFMNTAREAGASGGTVISARGQAHEGAIKFFGISVQDEKEIIIILTANEKKVAIMQAVCNAHGLNSKAQGIVFSLPVDNVMGLSFE
jgi:nitrogen regulatory protein PII